MSEHRHAEVLRAIADGREVEYFNPEYKEWKPMSGEINPLMYGLFNWRVKPKPPIVVDKHIFWGEDGREDGKTDGWTCHHLKEPNIRFTFDADTFLPIKVELI